MMCSNDKKVSDLISAAITEEKAKRIKKLVRKNFSEEFIMDIFELDAEAYKNLYNRLYPFGHYVGPFAQRMEDEIKTRCLRRAGYTEEEIQVILQKYPIFFPKSVEKKLDAMFIEELKKRNNQDE